MKFVKCQACGREVRLWNARVSLQRDVKLMEDAKVENEDGTFECPFCGVSQTPGE
jgi:transcription elongation factor Elf1